MIIHLKQIVLRRANRNAFSLLELILALGLTVIVISAITTAMRLYMFQLQERQQEIEQKQVSRGVIRMITEDVRAAIQYKAEDYSALENLIASQSLSGIGGGVANVDPSNVNSDDLEQSILDAVEAGGGAGGTANESTVQGGASEDGDTEGGAESEEGMEGESEEEEELGRPTLIGNNYFLRIDTSRLPRLDEYNPLVSQRETERLPSDIKAVTYFFSTAKPRTEEALADDAFGSKGGLYRRRIDRAVESYQSGDDDVEIILQPDEYTELIAPEIAAIQFRYWDGEQWRAEWDSSEEGGFPAAIEVQVVIDPERAIEQVLANESDAREFSVETIRSVIHLPVAEVIDEEDESGEESR